MLTHYCHCRAARITSSPEIIFCFFASTCLSGLLNVVVHFGRFLTLDPKCTGTFWASSMGRLTFDPKCTDTFWAVLTRLWLPKCTGTFWVVSTERLIFDPKCTGTFWAVPMVLWLTCLAFECACFPTLCCHCTPLTRYPCSHCHHHCLAALALFVARHPHIAVAIALAALPCYFGRLLASLPSPSPMLSPSPSLPLLVCHPCCHRPHCCHHHHHPCLRPHHCHQLHCQQHCHQPHLRPRHQPCHQPCHRHRHCCSHHHRHHHHHSHGPHH